MSFIINENEEPSLEVGQTSVDEPAVSGKKKKKGKKKKSKKKKSSKEKSSVLNKEEKSGSFNVWDVMMLISLICVIAACFLLIMELRSFSNFPFSYPWKTTDVNF